ncbi:MAG: hypothetical protein LAO23_19680 [Acidobacteriia bacterium]|nr:hypothetical protein [Terriglobia bacterium]
MKQGRASTSNVGSTKVEPRSHAVSPVYTNTLGAHYGTHVTDQGRVPGLSQPMYEGRGLNAPMVSQTTHKAGSQGRK